MNFKEIKELLEKKKAERESQEALLIEGILKAGNEYESCKNTVINLNPEKEVTAEEEKAYMQKSSKMLLAKERHAEFKKQLEELRRQPLLTDEEADHLKSKILNDLKEEEFRIYNPIRKHAEAIIKELEEFIKTAEEGNELLLLIGFDYRNIEKNYINMIQKPEYRTENLYYLRDNLKSNLKNNAGIEV